MDDGRTVPAWVKRAIVWFWLGGLATFYAVGVVRALSRDGERAAGRADRVLEPLRVPHEAFHRQGVHERGGVIVFGRSNIFSRLDLLSRSNIFGRLDLLSRSNIFGRILGDRGILGRTSILGRLDILGRCDLTDRFIANRQAIACERGISTLTTRASNKEGRREG